MNADALFDSLSYDLLGAGATPSTMFGKRSLTINGKAFARLKEGLLAFRLGAGSHEHQDALALPGAELFDRLGKRTPSKIGLPSLWPMPIDGHNSAMPRLSTRNLWRRESSQLSVQGTPTDRRCTGANIQPG